MSSTLKVEIHPIGPLETNCYFVIDIETKEIIVVDPAYDGHHIWNEIQERGLKIHMIFITHGHYDHIGGAKELKDLSGAEVWIHKDDAPMLHHPEKNFSTFMGTPYACESDGSLEPGQEIKLGHSVLKVLHIPGHTQGSTGLLGEGFAIVGDTLFRRGVGRTDFPGSSADQLYHAIRTQLFVLDDDTVIYPGHGPATTVGEEKNENPIQHYI